MIYMSHGSQPKSAFLNPKAEFAYDIQNSGLGQEYKVQFVRQAYVYREHFKKKFKVENKKEGKKYIDEIS